jgi:hypothetical protein
MKLGLLLSTFNKGKTSLGLSQTTYFAKPHPPLASANLFLREDSLAIEISNFSLIIFVLRN